MTAPVTAQFVQILVVAWMDANPQATDCSASPSAAQFPAPVAVLSRMPF